MNFETKFNLTKVGGQVRFASEPGNSVFSVTWILELYLIEFAFQSSRSEKRCSEGGA